MRFFSEKWGRIVGAGFVDLHMLLSLTLLTIKYF